MSVDSILVYRASVQRKLSTGTDDYGHPQTSLSTVHTALPIFFKPLAKSKNADPERVSLMVRYRGYAYEDADLAFEDVISRVNNLNGVNLFAGNFRITEIVKWPGSHLSFECEVPRGPSDQGGVVPALGAFTMGFDSGFDI